ncbi:MAG: sulfate reduction electron transfer complex DsrMKJOP subunit DsrM [Thermoanaerobacteraceae bacterium]|nr:sulfate reduction electron transfer complex DsrMKJOP subunit DsrM [Thermoanaerobacteraceae bacterium]
MGMGLSALLVIALVLLAFLGVQVAGLQFLFGVVIPYAAFFIFLAGVVYRIVKWAQSPVPFRIPTTCGQQKSLPWIKSNKIDNPASTAGVIARMALEVLFFRSLFRNVRAELKDGPKIVYTWEKWLWLAGLLFHWSMLLVIIRHLRFFADPIPSFVKVISSVDGFFEIGLQHIYVSGIILLLAVTYLFIRRVAIPQVRYISLLSDYFPLLVIFTLALTGILMRYFMRENVVAVKQLALGLATFNPTVPEGISVLFYIHLFLVSVLFAYFPFSKLVHMGGIFLSPTRNLPNDSRARRHINPWNYPVEVHSYEEYEDEFRQVMKAVGIPVEKE